MPGVAGREGNSDRRALTHPRQFLRDGGAIFALAGGDFEFTVVSDGLSSAEIPVAAPYFMGHVMRVEFRKFIELQTGNPVAVNPSLVRCIRPADPSGHALIEFGDDHVVAVTADVDDAASMLTIA